ncbi:MAG: DedA family protein [Candidatus Tectimicrobiota bacterium]
MWALIDFLTGYTASFIYLFIFLGLFVGGLGAPVPEDLLLLLGGFLSWAGYTDLYTTIAISIVGAVVGDYVVFYLGCKWGPNILGHPRFRRWLTSRRLSKIHLYFDRYGGKTVFFARFFAGFRLAVYLVAGMIRMNAQKFVMTDLCGAVLSVPLVTLLGYFLSEKIDTLRRTFIGVRIFTALLVVFAILAILVYRRWLRAYLRGAYGEPRVAEESPADEQLPTAKGGAREGG